MGEMIDHRDFELSSLLSQRRGGEGFSLGSHQNNFTHRSLAQPQTKLLCIDSIAAAEWVQVMEAHKAITPGSISPTNWISNQFNPACN